jgi:hypothetical protein
MSSGGADGENMGRERLGGPGELIHPDASRSGVGDVIVIGRVLTVGCVY